TTEEPADTVVPATHRGSQPSYDLARVCPGSSNDAFPVLPSSCLCVSRSSSHPRSDTLSRRAAWDGLDASAAPGVVAAVLLRPWAASFHESASARVCPVPAILNRTTRRGIGWHGHKTEELYAGGVFARG